MKTQTITIPDLYEDSQKIISIAVDDDLDIEFSISGISVTIPKQELLEAIKYLEKQK